jgi:hypothetical protein
MKYYRNIKSRNLWSFTGEKENWEIGYIQTGKAEEAKSGLNQAFGFIKYLARENLITIPETLFSSVDCYTGQSGRKNYYFNKPTKTWYEEIPYTDIIIERRTKKIRVNLLYISMYDKLNLGLTISSENFWTLFLLYNEKILNRISDDCEKFDEVVNCWKYFGVDEKFIEQEDKGITIRVGCNSIKLSPDRKFFLWGKHKIYLNSPYTFNNKDDCELIKNNFFTIKDSLNEVDIVADCVFENEYFIRIIFFDKDSKNYFICDKFGNSCIPAINQPFIVFPEIFGEELTAYFVKGEISIPLSTHDSGWFAEFYNNFDENITLNNLQTMISTINNKFSRNIIQVFSGKIPYDSEEEFKGKIALCVAEEIID